MATVRGDEVWPEVGVVRVQRIVTAEGSTSWMVLGEDALPLQPVERFLRFLAETGRAPNTVRAYAFDLRDFFVYLAGRGVDWRAVRLEDLGGFVAWLRAPAGALPGVVVPLGSVRGVGGAAGAGGAAAATVNRKLAALSSFYEFHARHGLDLGELLITWRAHAGALGTSWRPFLEHVAAGRPQRRRALRLREERSRPRVLSAGEVARLLRACGRLRDRLLLTVLVEAGLRIGEALGLRHEDLDPQAGVLRVRPRENANGAQAKSGDRQVPIGPGLGRLYADYLFDEYGELDSDYVFVNLWAAPLGAPLTYSSVADLIARLRARTGIHVRPHQFRHTYATNLLRAGVDVAVVAALLGHASSATTIDTYSHLDPEDLRRALQAAGVLDGPVPAASPARSLAGSPASAPPAAAAAARP